MEQERRDELNEEARALVAIRRKALNAYLLVEILYGDTGIRTRKEKKKREIKQYCGFPQYVP